MSAVVLTTGWLKKCRLRGGWSQSDLAAKLSVHRTQISRWEHADMTIGLRSLLRICPAVGLSLTIQPLAPPARAAVHSLGP